MLSGSDAIDRASKGTFPSKGIFGFLEVGNDVCVPGRDPTSVRELPEQTKDLPCMSFNATPKPPSGREGIALKVFRKE
jgi:hypothetical protein